jgi:hypothetical protein
MSVFGICGIIIKKCYKCCKIVKGGNEMHLWVDILIVLRKELKAWEYVLRPTTPNNLFLVMAYYKLVFYVQGAWHSQTKKHSFTPVVGRLVFSIRSSQSSDASFVGVVFHSRETTGQIWIHMLPLWMGEQWIKNKKNKISNKKTIS